VGVVAGERVSEAAGGHVSLVAMIKKPIKILAFSHFIEIVWVIELF
jgi:hypothetical protein